ncbi:class II aldolase/adducin family protein [Fodinicurvata sediminis]|uniref:class II aldolase/adducin family protein n=1 Tax=Fodinicurvata sediminis TaxID=1121832 RepID=UPI00058E9124|nr:class II aldolase/adducin family protein [Fodinicurvata sediminis]
METALNVISRQQATLRDQVSSEEWEARVNLAACYRLMALYGMTDLIYNHISARVPGHPDQFLINSYGLRYNEMTASSLCKIDHEGNILLDPGTGYGINQAGFVIHSAVHEARPDVDCVIHTHTRAGMAVSAMKCGLLPIAQTSMRFHNRVGYHDYEGVALDLDERARLVADLGPHYAMILRNHGLLTCGLNIAHAFNLMYWLENACKVQVDVMNASSELQLPPEEVCEKTAKLYDPDVRRVYGEMEWQAMLRQVDEANPGYDQ